MTQFTSAYTILKGMSDDKNANKNGKDFMRAAYGEKYLIRKVIKDWALMLIW